MHSDWDCDVRTPGQVRSSSARSESGVLHPSTCMPLCEFRTAVSQAKQSRAQAQCCTVTSRRQAECLEGMNCLTMHGRHMVQQGMNCLGLRL